MQIFNLGDNIIRLRHEKKLTQEEIAAFVGVTKASVSKWENRQSMPDISILPALATLFDVSIDELLGYEPQLEDKQIRRIYQSLSEEFVNNSFEDAYNEVLKQVRQYYNCYPFLLHMCVLMINHYNLAGDDKNQNDVLLEVQNWCCHIRENCKAANIVQDAIAVHTVINYLLKKYREVIEVLKEEANPLRMSNGNDKLLIQTYAMLGDMDNTEKYAQTIMYNSILNIVACSTLLLSVLMPDKDWCNDTINRIAVLNSSYKLNDVNKNTMVQYYYQAAINKVFYGEKEEAYYYLDQFIEQGIDLIKNPEKLFIYDSYFKKVEEWTNEAILGVILPRDKSFITSDISAMLEHPLLQSLAGENRFEKIKRKIKEEL